MQDDTGEVSNVCSPVSPLHMHVSSLHPTSSGYPGQDITQSQYYSFNIVQRNNVINATLRINELSPALIGDYNCSASNVVDGEYKLDLLPR